MLVTGLGQAVLAIPIVFLTVAFISVILRFCAVRIRGRPWKLHDTLIVIALAFGLVQLGFVYFEVIQGGLGLHHDQLIFPQVVNLGKGIVGHSVSWILATHTAKLSVLAFYLDIFSVRITFRHLTYGFMGFVVTYAIASILCVFTICRPLQKIWDPNVPGHCGNIMNAMFATAIINSIEDLLVVVMPMPILWRLQVSQQKKIAMSAVIGVGLFICIINMVRLGFARALDQQDTPYTQAYQTLFMNLEVQLGVISACLPTIKPLFTRRKPAVHGAPSYASYGNGPKANATIGSEGRRKHSHESDETLLFADSEKVIELTTIEKR